MADRLEVVKYEEDHWVVHLDDVRMAFFLLFLGRCASRSPVFGLEDYQTATAAYKSAPGDMELLARIMRANDLPVGQLVLPASVEEKELPAELEQLLDTQVWKSIEKAVPPERVREVLTNLHKALDNKKALDRKSRAESEALDLIFAFTWDHTPPGNDYWSAWWYIADGRNRAPPPVFE